MHKILKLLLQHTLADAVGGLIIWLFKGCKSDIKTEIVHPGWRNETVAFMTLVGLIVVVLLIITLIT
ncbi:MAG: hypothetical protein ABIH87_02615 [bacterium]